ncbi:uncharacterized protein METZ01_LOCUS116896, partial [marine metagenome]
RSVCVYIRVWWLYLSKKMYPDEM